jgi:creatinine amidohydrolase/Fe(II)-dependent formamide hydrolase-like protein
VVGNPAKASVEIGKKGLEMKIDQAIREYREIKAQIAKRRNE